MVMHMTFNHLDVGSNPIGPIYRVFMQNILNVIYTLVKTARFLILGLDV